MNDIEICPICRKPYSQKYPKEKYHLQYQPYGEFIYACGKCNYAEYLSRHKHKYLTPWLWRRLWLVKKFGRENPHLKY
ncbi:MAG: hypothetical protein WC735_04865 [Candidatus Paceibacterota bacterium]